MAYPNKVFAVNLLRWIVSMLGSLSKHVDISASEWVRQFPQKYLFSPVRCSILANWDRAQGRLLPSCPFFGVGENVLAVFASYTLSSCWTGTLISWKLSNRFLASSHVMHLVWCRSCPWNNSSTLLICLLTLLLLFELTNRASKSLTTVASSIFFLTSFSVSWRFTSKLHKNSWASCCCLSSNIGFCFLFKEKIFKKCWHVIEKSG